MTYDCEQDVLEHRRKVKTWLTGFTRILDARTETHDQSKLEEPEKSMFDVFTPKLKELEFGSDEYKKALLEMGTALTHHYENNRHHPEHYESGVNGMTIIDLVEMIADWMGAAEAKRKPVDIDYLATRFNLSPQLVEIIANTLREEDVWCAINGFDRGFCPEKYRAGHVEGFGQVTKG